MASDKYAHNSSKKKAETKERFNDVRFVNYDLSADEKVQCKAWLPDLSLVDDALLKLVESGYRVTLRYDERSSGYSCFVQSTDEKSDNAGLMLTGRGSTPLKAAKNALFKHFVVFDLVWSAWAEKPSATEFDD